MKPDVFKIFGVGNTPHEITEKVELTLYIGEDKITQQFHVFPNQFDMILGMDFIKKNDVKLDFSTSQIVIRNMTHKLQPPATRSMLAKTVEPITIMAYTGMDVKVRLAKQVKNSFMVLEQVSSLQRRAPGVSVAHSVTNTQYTYCRIINESDMPVSLPENNE